ncbi:unnamed protein product [Peniophora sp. CBMAI 1063]|nr:unnamed protein product [Peniophora sp. CBMAI 1063]
MSQSCRLPPSSIKHVCWRAITPSVAIGSPLWLTTSTTLTMDHSAFATTRASTTRTVIHDLPAEIILSVFSHIVTNDIFHGSSHVAPAIVISSQVCSRWRSIALSHSQCWSNVDICARYWSKLFAERAGGQALSLIARRPVSSEQMQLFEPYLARVRGLVLGSSAGGGKRSNAESAPNLLSPSATPLLESLHLEDQPQYEYHATAPPSLRRLILRDGCHISPLFPILNSTLVHLELSRCHSVEAAGSDVVHAILLGLPHLQTLVLDYARKSHVASPSALQARPATLPRLHRLHIRDTLSNLVRRLQLLDIPSEAQITVASEEPVSIATLGAVAALTNFLSGHTSAVSHTLTVDAPTPGTCTGRIALSYQSCQGGRELSRMELATGAGHAPMPCILRKLLGSGQLHVHDLHVSHGHFFAPCAWTDLHRLTPDAMRITAIGQANIVNGLLQVLHDGAYAGMNKLTVANVVLGSQAGLDMTAWANVRAKRASLDMQLEACVARAEPLLIRCGDLAYSDACWRGLS